VKREALAAALVVVLLAVAFACSPAQRAAIPAEERAACVLLRAALPDTATVCATADELAPFVAELLAAQAAAPASTGALAFSLPPPRGSRAPARRHCAAWTAVDGGAEAGPDGGR
jgi:hypothetical protein